MSVVYIICTSDRAWPVNSKNKNLSRSSLFTIHNHNVISASDKALLNKVTKSVFVCLYTFLETILNTGDMENGSSMRIGDKGASGSVGQWVWPSSLGLSGARITRVH
jgi:hypothetical protein